eukprot:Phypoly_transcript_01686.p1 GENE.Phypoly_transcript_01686~~Phypoly_transcript_01686.p1  ORF type:complete len:1051 (+),score=172.81 Phypoly_transcript_01686:443-3154(+)
MEDLSQIAIGLCNGAVVVVRGDILRDKTPKQKILRPDAPDQIVTGLGFRQQGKSQYLFVITSNSIASYLTSGKDQEIVVDDQGCDDPGCVVMSDEQDLIIGRPEAVYFYGVEGRGPCFGFEGIKRKLVWFRNYLIVVGEETQANPMGGGTTSTPSSSLKNNTFSIYDLKNKFIAFSENKFENVSQVVCEWGCIFVFTGDGKIYQLEEKDTQTKLETLFKKNLYSVAINLAHSQHYDYNSIIDIFRKYGDHLYDKGDYDGAISQYLKTIGRLEPSYVIRKFLDAQRIHNLTSYLQALHEKNLANADHTTLLLNCYTKLKDVKKLDQFIKTDSGFNFEVETAIKVLRQAGYYEHALYLAEKHNEHDWYLKILLEDVNKYDKAIEYIGTLNFFEAEKNLKKYGKSLVSNLPDATTNLLMRLCTTYTPSIPKSASQSVAKVIPAAPAPSSTSSFANFSQHTAASIANFSTAAASLANFSTSPMSSSPTSTKMSESPMDEHSMRDELLGTSKRTAERDILSFDANAAASDAKAAPEEFIHIFVNQPEWLTKFLEFIVSQGDAPGPIYNTLLELYLREEKNDSSDNDRRRRTEKAMDLLTNPDAKYDPDHALVLAQVHNFRSGILYLYEKLHLYIEIIQYHMEHNEYEHIIRACKKYGELDPNLWVQALSYFAAKEEDRHKEIMEVLANIDRDNLIPPLLVIQILAQKPTTTLSVIKEYMTKRLMQENQAIQDDLRAIRAYNEETEKMRTEITELRTNAKIFQQSKCTVCQSQLDLPAVHFLCNHSFHQRCLGENERECPVCTPGNRRVLEIKRSLAENAGQHDQFFKQLENASDGFNVVSEYFGRGIFNAPVVQTPATPGGVGNINANHAPNYSNHVSDYGGGGGSMRDMGAGSTRDMRGGQRAGGRY